MQIEKYFEKHLIELKAEAIESTDSEETAFQIKSQIEAYVNDPCFDLWDIDPNFEGKVCVDTLKTFQEFFEMLREVQSLRADSENLQSFKKAWDWMKGQ